MKVGSKKLLNCHLPEVVYLFDLIQRIRHIWLKRKSKMGFWVLSGRIKRESHYKKN
jgi:hypothetical protein